MLEGFTPWPQELVRYYKEKGYWEDLTIADVLDASIAKYGDKEVLVYGDLRLTYKELGQKVDRLALHFLEIGLKPQDRVVLQLPNSPEFIYTFLALAKIGVIPVMALAPHRQAEIRHFLKSSGAVGYFIAGEYSKFNYLAMAEEMKAETESLKYIFVAGEKSETQTGAAQTEAAKLGAVKPEAAKSGTMTDGIIYLNDLLAQAIEARYEPGYLSQFRPDPMEVALMLLSGGTTALSKLIPRTHNDYVYNFKQSGRVAGMSEQTVLLAVLPLGHNYSLGSPGLLAALANGGKVVIAPDMDADNVFSLVEKEKVTIIPAAVPLIARWVNSPVPELYNLESLQVVQNGGARLAPELRRRLIEKFDCIPQEVFGTAEGLLNLTRLDDEEDLLLNSSGSPICPDDEIKVVDRDGREVPDGESGELICRGPYTIRGYYNLPETNKKSFTADGFYRMGDIVRKQGRYIFTEGRKNDLINRGGEKISCDEVEGFILRHPKVHNVALIAMPDEVFGERACAYVMPKAGEKITFQELIEFLKGQKIAKFKLPERLEIVQEFPLSPAGKILRRVLREDITAKLEQESKMTG